MSLIPPEPSKAARQRHHRAKRARQTVVTLLLFAIVAGGAVVGVAIYTGKMDSPFDRGFTTPTTSVPAVVPPPCPTSPKVKPVAPAKITVNVLNGTDREGLAGKVAAELKKRKFKIGTVGNDTTGGTDKIAIVRTGPKGVNAAYTVLAQVSEGTIELDNRTDASVDLIVGGEYKALVAVKKVVLDMKKPIVAPADCQPVALEE